MAFEFIIYTPVYRDNSGGIIVLHKLASVLRSMGYSAKIWPQPKPSLHELRKRNGWKKLKRWIKLRFWSNTTQKELKSPYKLEIAHNKDIRNSIIVYPEIISGNPLGAKRVVRWLLNKPGLISGKIDFGDDDLFFYYNEHFNDWSINPNKEHHLNVSEPMIGTYVEKNHGERKGQCYMVRKGRDRPLIYHDDGALKVDGLTHEELAEIFNQYKYFICYDLYTMYCRYAAMCGCIPVVMPEKGISKEDWRPEIFNRYGIAYGWDDINWAIESRGQLLDFISKSEQLGYDSVKKFISIAEDYFTAGRYN